MSVHNDYDMLQDALAELEELEALEALVALLLHVHLLEVLVEVLVVPEELVA